MKFPHRFRARRTGIALFVAAVITARRGGIRPGIPDLAALAADFGRG